MKYRFTFLTGQPSATGRHLLIYLIGLLSIWSTFSANAQPSAFTSNQIEVGSDCNWPYSAIATNPTDGKMYAFWRKGANADVTYKLIRWDGSSWTQLSTFTTATGSSSSIKVPDFSSAGDRVSLAIDKSGRFHVTFSGTSASVSKQGIWYGLSPNGTSWSFQALEILPANSTNETLYEQVIEVDPQNQPHVAFRSNTSVAPRTYTLRYYRFTGSSWVGETAFTQSGSSNGGTTSNEIGRFDLAIDGNAKAHFSFRRETVGTGRDGSLYYINNTSGSWSTPQELVTGPTDQPQAVTNTIDTDAANKIHIVHSDYQHKLYYTTNVSGPFVTSQINGNVIGDVSSQHTLRINANGDKFVVYNDNLSTSTGLNYAYQLAGTSGSTWTTGTGYTPNASGRGGNYYSGLMNNDRRIMLLFDNSLTSTSGQCNTFTRNLWYATATVNAPAPPTAAPVVSTPANGSLLTSTTPAYTGTAPSGSTVTVYIDGTAIGTTTATGGNFSLTQPTALSQGSHTVRATAQLSGQTVSANSNTNTFTVDSVRPSVSISSTSSNPTSVSPVPITVTFSEPVTGFVAGDVTPGNGTLSGFSGSGTTYTFNVIPSANGAVTVNVPANVAQDAAGNGNTAASQFSVTYSQPVTTAPVVTTPANGSLLNSTTPAYAGTAPSGSTVTVYIDGSSIGTTTATGGNFSLTQPTALAQGSHTVYATAQVSGQAGSANSNTNTFTVDVTSPTVTSVSVPANATYRNPQTLSFTVNFSETVTVTGTPQLGLTIGSTTRQADYVSGSGSSALVFTYTVQTGELDADGIALASALTLNGGAIRDAVTNNATLTLNGVPSTTGILIDAVAPTVSISSSAGANGSTTGTSPIPFTVTFSENVTGFVSADVSVTGGSLADFSGSGTTYTFTVTPSANGAVTVNVPANVAQDAAGNGNTAASQFSITYSQPITATPVVTTPANGSLLTIATPTYTGTAPSGSTVTVYVDGTAIGTTTASGGNFSLVQPTNLAQGSHTVYATALVSGQTVSANSNTNTFTVDSVRPNVSISSTSSNPTSVSPIPFTVTFSEPVTGFVAGDVTLGNGTLSGFSGSGTSYTFNVTPSANGAVTVNVPANVAQDAAGNGNTAATQFSITYSQPVTATPVVTTPANGSLLNSATPAYTGTAPSGSTVTVYVDGTSIGTTTATGGNFSLNQPTALAQGSHTVYATAQVSGQTVSASSNTNTFSVDTVRPSVTIVGPASANTAPIVIQITFSEAVTGFTATDLTLSNAAVSNFAGSGTTYNVELTPPASGLVSVDLAAGVAQDAAGNPNTAASPYSVPYTPNQAPTAIMLSGNSVAENQPAGTPVGTLSTTDADGGQTFTYTLVGGAGSADNASFSIVGNQLRTAAAFDFEARSSYTIRVRSTDSGTPQASVEQNFLINVLNGNELQVTVSNKTDVSCFGRTDGSLTVTASGEPGPYTYRWSVASSSDATLSGLPAGTYSVTVTAATGFTATTTTTITQPPVVNAPTLQASALSTTNQPISVTASGCSGGTINWTLVGGSGSPMGAVYTIAQPGNYTLSASCTVGSCASSSAASLSLQIRPGGFAITGVSMVNCQLIDAPRGQYQVRFTPLYSGQTTDPIAFSVVNELATTTAPAPYTLRLYNDNAVITLVAAQAGNGEARFAYNWLASCQTGTSPNQPPTTTGIPTQNILVGQGYQLALSNYFSDPDGQQLSYSGSGLPAGLSLNGSVISGVPSQTGVSSVSVTALDPGGLQVSASFQLTVSPMPSIPAGFTIIGVSTVSCSVLSAGERRLTFNPQYGGQSSGPISFSVVNEKLPTTDPGPYSLNLYTDNPVITLSASQGSNVATYAYNWLAVCNPAGRQGVSEIGTRLQVRVLGNPVEGKTAEVEISGALGQAVELNLVDLQGKSWHMQRIDQAGSQERVLVPMGSSRGLLLLQVNTPTQHQQIKLLKP